MWKHKQSEEKRNKAISDSKVRKGRQSQGQGCWGNSREAEVGAPKGEQAYPRPLIITLTKACLSPGPGAVLGIAVCPPQRDHLISTTASWTRHYHYLHFIDEVKAMPEVTMLSG